MKSRLHGSVNWNIFKADESSGKSHFRNVLKKCQNLNRHSGWKTFADEEEVNCLRNVHFIINLKSHQLSSHPTAQRFAINWFFANFSSSYFVGVVGPDWFRTSETRNRFTLCHETTQRRRELNGSNWFSFFLDDFLTFNYSTKGCKN